MSTIENERSNPFLEGNLAPCAQAITEDPIAVVHVPVRIPNGFHGNWIAD